MYMPQSGDKQRWACLIALEHVQVTPEGLLVEHLQEPLGIIGDDAENLPGNPNLRLYDKGGEAYVWASPNASGRHVHGAWLHASAAPRIQCVRMNASV